MAKALAADVEAALVEKMNDKLAEESDSDNEGEEVDDMREIEIAGGGGLMAPPPYSDLSGGLGPLGKFAQSAGNTWAGNFLRKANESFVLAHATKPARKADMREVFVES